MTDHAIEAFIQRWSKAGGSERANYQLFLTQLCTLLDLPQPEPAGDDTRDNSYVFERRVVINQPDGSSNNGFIDLYKRGSFVLEAKQTGKTLDSSGWDKAMLRAHNQADQYARALPADEGRPPFILVTDVGRNIELYAEFSRSGATYTPFPDPRSHRIRLEDLRKEEVRDRLKAVWLDPLSLDPSRRSARVTREIADQLAKLAKSLEAAGHAPQQVAGFLMRALFTMFAEDVGLLPERAFTELLQSLKTDPASFAPMLEHLWQTMNTGGFSPILRSTVLRFNGGLFAEASAIALDRDQMELLLKASEADWRFVEPAIFGTLLERALNPRERHKLGAHYTPRAYVERLVLPTVIEPLRAEWKEVQAAALTYEQQGKTKQAIEEIRTFHRHLCDVRVLDPACGSGNFLYVTLEHMKRLEGEVLNLLHDFGESQGLLELEGVTVDPHQFLGMEINPRAAKIAEMVLWIGYLQWHFRTHGSINPPEPVLRDFHNIEHRDALIAYDAVELVIDERGMPLTRWDGVTKKTSPITGEEIPDESAQVEQYRYISPRKAEWPQADYIVGNPPFVGASGMRRVFGDGYTDAVRKTWNELPESADFVMYWWNIAATKVKNNEAKQFGFITTSTIKNTLNRRIIQAHLDSEPPLNICFAIPDHPWVDAADGAQVRICMTVGGRGDEGIILSAIREGKTGGDEIQVDFCAEHGLIHANLKTGANLATTAQLLSNSSLSNRGVIFMGDGFILNEDDATRLRSDTNTNIIKKILNGNDVTKKSRNLYAIDFFGKTLDQIKRDNPDLYQWTLDRVKPVRDQDTRRSRRERWWLFAENQPRLRAGIQGLTRYLVTPMTAKHRIFTFIEPCTLADQGLIAISFEDAYPLGVLSSRAHVCWAIASGARRGVGNDPRYNNTRCFETFAFPTITPEQEARIRELAEQLDAHRKRQQAMFPGLALTGIYNVLEKLRAGEELTAKEKVIHTQGLVSLLRELHDELDRAVFAAYGWDDLAEQLVGLPGATTPLPDKPEAQAEAEEELLRRLVELNAAHAAEEARGLIRWLRPDYQNPSATVAPQQAEAELTEESADETPAATAPAGKLTWPKNMREQVAAVRTTLARQSLPMDAIAGQFKRSPKVAVQAVLEALEELGMVYQEGEEYRLAG